MNEERKPVAVCTKCGKYSFRAESINQQCSQVYDRKRCKGCFGSSLAVNDWAACDICHGSGQESHRGCEACQGTGWLFVRK